MIYRNILVFFTKFSHTIKYFRCPKLASYLCPLYFVFCKNFSLDCYVQKVQKTMGGKNNDDDKFTG